MKSVCKNHPDREAKRNCYYCKEPICSECQLNIAHHIYCSRRCYYLQLVTTLKTKIKQLYTLIQSKNFFNYRNLIDIILIIAIFISIKLSIDNQRLINKLSIKKSIPDTTVTTIPLDSLARKIDTLKISAPPPSTMILHNRFDIEGETTENRIVSISANGRLLDAKVVKGRKFAFKGIVAKPGQNLFTVRSMNEDGSSVILEEIKLYFGRPSLSFLARDFVRGDINEKKVALTFDGGYLDNAAHEILDILKQENVKATFFLTGIFLKKYPELVKRMVAERHEIGNHTWTHPHLTTYAQNKKHETLKNVTREMVQQELLRTDHFFKLITGKKMSGLWRAPYGEHNREIRLWAAEVGFRHVGWTVGKRWEDGMDSLDWVADKNSPAYHSAEEIAEKILSFGHDTKYGASGAIILMHLGTERVDDYPHQKLPMIIDQFKKQGYQFVTISEML